ncbi:hypothetical protein ACHQM5_016399 [Ranunculus cassubicifolius]
MDSKKAIDFASSRKMTCQNVDPFNKLDDGVMENILARSRMIDLFYLQLVCKRWGSLILSSEFKITSRQLVNRFPWLFMVDFESSIMAAYDMEARVWRQNCFPIPTNIDGTQGTPLTSSSGLMCLKTDERNLIVCNPLTGSTRLIQELELDEDETVAMHVGESYFKVFLFQKRSLSTEMKVYSSLDNTWTSLSIEKHISCNAEDEDTYSWSWIPSHGVAVVNASGTVMVYYVNDGEHFIGVDTDERVAYVYPLPLKDEAIAYSFAECMGRIFAVVLTALEAVAPDQITDEGDSDVNLGKATLQLLELGHENQWKAVAKLPENMCADYNFSDALVMCGGYDNYILICLSPDLDEEDPYMVISYKLLENSWEILALPPCYDCQSGARKSFTFTIPVMPSLHKNLQGENIF